MAKFDFQHVASNYDDIHVHAPEVSQAIGAYLVQRVGSGRRILEIGIGTGRIARPVLDHGCEVVGFDISHGMLAVAQKRQIHNLLIADMMTLPFVDASFDATLAVHVLHHAPDWRVALREAVRVLKPGGLFIEGRDWNDPTSCAMRMRHKMREVIMQLSPGIRPPGAGAAKQQFLAEHGGVSHAEEVATSWQAITSPAQVLAGMYARNDSETWAIDSELLNATLVHVEEWARAEWPDFETPVPFERRFVVSITEIHHPSAQPEQPLAV
jgi:ubiquinone/menaquinone biosynthesis C-methylase UbiE